MSLADKPISNPQHSQTYDYLLSKYGISISWQDAAKETGIYWETIQKLCRQGDIAAQKIGRTWMLTTKALANFIDYGPITKRTQTEVPATKKERGHYKYVTPI